MIGKVLNNRYEIETEIGSGGMAVVYRGTDRLLGRKVAIKVLREQFIEDQEFLERFHREAQSAAKLSHPNVINIFDLGNDDIFYFIVMEYLEVTTLKEIIKDRGYLSPQEAVNFCSQVAKALSYAHQHGIIHRDIKPHNILVNKNGHVKVSDFGIARAVSSSTLTQTGAVLGSVHYLSPEQAQGKEAGVQSDIYSLGVVLYEMVTGKLPFEGETPIAVALKHIQAKPLDPSSFNPDVPNSLKKIISRTLAKDPEARYQSADELLKDLSKATSEKEIIDSPTLISSPLLTKPKKKRLLSSKKFLGLLIITFIIFGVIASGIIFVVTKPDLFQKKIAVPSLVNKDLQQAKQELKDKKLNLVVQEEIYSTDLPVGYILSQKPPQGEMVKQNTPIRVVVSRGALQLEVPDLRGIDFKQAQKILLDKGLDYEVSKYIFDDKIPKNSVISQEPLPNKKVEAKKKVILVVSLGAFQIRVPNLVGEEQGKAMVILGNDGLVMEVSKEDYSVMEAGKIISQNPVAGETVKRGTKIKVVVSKGPKDTIVPNLVGKDVKTARTMAVGFNLTLEGDKDGIVIEQSPSAGTTAKQNSSIVVKVSGSEVLVPRIIGLLLLDAKNKLKEKGLLLGTETTVTDNKHPNGTVLQQDPQPDTKIARGTKVNIVISSTGPVKTPEPTKTTEPSNNVSVPNVVGKTLAQAEEDLLNAGLRVGEKRYVRASKKQENLVLSQRPAGGIPVLKGTRIDLVIGLEEEE